MMSTTQTPAKRQTFLDSRLGLRRPCEHNCFDKSACGHPCCHDGIPISPKVSETPTRKRTMLDLSGFACKTFVFA